MTDDAIRHLGRLDNGPALTSTARNTHRGTVTEGERQIWGRHREGEEMKNHSIRRLAVSYSPRRRPGKAAVALTAVFVAAALLLPAATATTPAAAASLAPPLTRYPYLTDVVGGNASVNFGTDQSKISAVVKWGQAGVESCTAHTTTATKTNLSVNGVGEYQWKAQLSPLQPDTAYCYRVYFGTSQIDLLGSDPSPQFVTQVPAGSTEPFTFAVLGDWGKTYADGNPDQANLMQKIAASGARFVVGTGDTGYPAGSQKSYGDLQQSGLDISAVFGPQYWTVVGKSIPMFNAEGNHAPTTTFITNWPSDVAAAASGGQNQMNSYCCFDGITAKSYGSVWYAFDVGNARIYVLEAAWDGSNVGTGSQYQDDYDAHWAPGAQPNEYAWLQNDLAAHPNQLKFAV